jgi:hypothetical protein
MEDHLWSRTDHLLLRAESLLHASAGELDSCRDRRQRERQRTREGLEALRLKLAASREELLSLIEAMAVDPVDDRSLKWQTRLQGQLALLEHALVELDQWHRQLEAPQDSGWA